MGVTRLSAFSDDIGVDVDYVDGVTFLLDQVKVLLALCHQINQRRELSSLEPILDATVPSLHPKGCILDKLEALSS